MAFSKIAAGGVDGGVGDSLRPNAKPLIINGDMAVAQRGTSVTGKTSTDIYTVDRMSAVIGSIGTYSIAQESQTSGNAFDNGFANAWRIDCTTADASPSASDQLLMQYTFEGQDLQLFKKGTANAEKFTLAFWVKSNKTGTGNIQLKDKDNSNRQCTQSYTISSADTWEHKVCVFGADTTGAFDDDNAKSLIINWWLGSGTDSSSGTANHGVWEAQDNTKVNSGGTLNINDNTANDWSITGIQLEVGEYTSATIPPFQHESFGDNLQRCKRYCFMVIYEDGTSKKIGDGYFWSANEVDMGVHFNPQMRANPTLIQVSGDDYFRIETNTGSRTIDASWSIQQQTKNAANCYVAAESSGTQGVSGNIITYNSNARFGFDAEL
ncbi:putative carbohydrate binding domain containing protein [uncultured Mediterranean phage uvMED]|nr:putative carbohydrate binding domain containing protein [uncultured Mediterranean phage uvMED]BAR37065.1 putative carbohydrate binding domain containing protein [uncultured Mediterranean phage uvMED]